VDFVQKTAMLLDGFTLGGILNGGEGAESRRELAS
jgi:hypothetical protein